MIVCCRRMQQSKWHIFTTHQRPAVSHLKFSGGRPVGTTKFIDLDESTVRILRSALTLATVKPAYGPTVKKSLVLALGTLWVYKMRTYHTNWVLRRVTRQSIYQADEVILPIQVQAGVIHRKLFINPPRRHLAKIKKTNYETPSWN